MTATINLKGMRFDRLLVVERDFSRSRRAWWKCQCDCGAVAVVASDKLRSGHTRSCGCLLADKNRELRQTHGHALKAGRSLTYKSYTAMVTRCENENAINYDRYGAVGVSICERWRFGTGEKSGFECFLADMGERPSAKHTIDRINQQKGYEPGNCRWVLGRTQVLNRSNTVMIDVNGYEIPLTVACDLTGIKYATAWARMRRGRAWNEART